jgi:hypothetical protein
MSFFNSESGSPLMAVGMLALIVAGIGGGAFLQGRSKDASTRAVVKKDLEVDEKTLEHFRLQIDRVQSDLDKSQDLVTTHQEWERLDGELRKSRPRATGLADQKTTLEEEVAVLRKEFDDYRTKYLRQIRTAAAGEKLDELSSRQGKVYRGVTIKRVTEAGLEFTHASGLATLKPDELADSWRERFQW